MRIFYKSKFKNLLLKHSYHLIIFSVILTTSFSAIGQDDTAGVIRYVVRQLADNEPVSQVLPAQPVGECSINVSSTVSNGSTVTYTLVCSDGKVADYWEVTCGSATQTSQDEITVQWNSSGCTSGTIKARKDDGTIIA